MKRIENVMKKRRYKITLYIEKRIVLYLAEHVYYRIGDQDNEDITQSGIQKAIGIRLEHVSRELKKLLDKKFIHIKSDYIKNHNRRKKVYFLSNKGLRFAEKIKFQFNNQWILIRTLDHELKEIKYYELRDFSDIELIPMEIYKYSSESKDHIIDLNKILTDKKKSNCLNEENRN